MAAAAIIAAPEAQSKPLQQLVSLLAWAPTRSLTPTAARLAAFAWFWVAAEAPAHLVRPFRDCHRCQYFCSIVRCITSIEFSWAL